MKKHQFVVTVEYTEDNRGEPVSLPPLRFAAPNHDNIFEIVEKIQEREGLPPETAQRFAVGLKLMTEVMMENRDHPLFAALKPYAADMMKTIKGKRDGETPL